MSRFNLLDALNNFIQKIVIGFFKLFGVKSDNKYIVWIIQFIKFNIVGLLNFLITTIIYYALKNTGIGAYAYAIGYTVGIVNSYICNKMWTFSSEKKFTGKEVVLFLILSFFALGVSQGLKSLMENLLSFNDSLSYFISLIIALGINYFGSKFVVFKK